MNMTSRVKIIAMIMGLVVTISAVAAIDARAAEDYSRTSEVIRACEAANGSLRTPQGMFCVKYLSFGDAGREFVPANDCSACVGACRGRSAGFGECAQSCANACGFAGAAAPRFELRSAVNKGSGTNR